MPAKYIASTKHEWSKMSPKEFESVCKKENLEKFKLDKFQSTDFCIQWANENRGNIVRYITNRTGKQECRGGGLLVLLGMKEDKSIGRVPEFIMLRNAYNPNIKPFSVQIKNIVSLWYDTEPPKRIIMNNLSDASPKRPVSPKSPRGQSIRKIRL